MNNPQNPAPQWAVEAAREIALRESQWFSDGTVTLTAKWAPIIARHAPQQVPSEGTHGTFTSRGIVRPPQPTAPTAQPAPAGEPPATGGTATPSDAEPTSMYANLAEYIAQLETELAEANTTARIEFERSAGLTAQLAEARAELANEKGQWEIEARNAGRLQAQLTAAQGVIARLREALATCGGTYESGITWFREDIRNTALSLTPATYGDALAKVTDMRDSDLFTLKQVKLHADALRAELAELRGLLERALGQLDSHSELSAEIRARLAKQENPS